VVIRKTAIVGEDVTLYQGVRLDGIGKEKGKRHLTSENIVSIGGARAFWAISPSAKTAGWEPVR